MSKGVSNKITNLVAVALDDGFDVAVRPVAKTLFVGLPRNLAGYCRGRGGGSILSWRACEREERKPCLRQQKKSIASSQVSRTVARRPACSVDTVSILRRSQMHGNRTVLATLLRWAKRSLPTKVAARRGNEEFGEREKINHDVIVDLPTCPLGSRLRRHLAPHPKVSLKMVLSPRTHAAYISLDRIVQAA